MTWQKLHSQLTNELHYLPEPCSRLAFLRCLQGWIQANLVRFPRLVRDRCHVDWYAVTKVEDYPVAYSSLDVVRTAKWLLAGRHGSTSTLVCCVTGVLREGITVESEEGVHDHPSSRYLREASNEIVLSCDTCSWCETSRGEQWVAKGALVIPTLAELLILLPASGWPEITSCDFLKNEA